MQLYCPHCAALTDVTTQARSEAFLVRGEPIETEHHFSVCNVCGLEFAAAEQAQIGLAAAREIYRNLHRLVMPEEITRIRAKYGAGQRAFGIVLGFGEATINSYEQGELPTDANSNLIRLAEDPTVFARLFAERNSLLGPTQRKRIQQHIELLAPAGGEKARDYRSGDTLELLCNEPPSEYSGFRSPDIVRLYALLAIILLLSEEPLFKTKLLKLAYLAELESFKSFTVSISGWPYARLPFGPVPQDYKKVLLAAESSGYVVSHDDEEDRVRFTAGETARTEAAARLDDRDLATIRSVVETYGNKAAAELSRITHRLPAWKKTDNAQLMSYAFSFDQ